MELSSSGLPDRLNNLNKVEQSPTRDKDETTDTQEQMVQRCVIIQKDEKGYGLTVSGDNPVFVQSVKDDGAAARAGVQQGDRIIKVNGTLVTQSNHQDVVELIKSGSYVALTLLGKPPGHGRTSSGTLQPLNISGTNTSPHSLSSNKLSSPSERITGPQPVDPEKQQQLTNSRIHTIRKMLEKEVVYLENLRMEYSKTPSEKIHAEVTGATNRVKTLEEQLINLTGTTHFPIIPRSPKSPPASHFHRHHHSEKENRHSVTSPTSGHQGRLLTHQVSAPTLPPKPDLLSTSHAKAHSVEQNATHENVHSPENVVRKDSCSSTKQSLSASLENIDKQFANRSTTWPQVGPTHTRQTSSPEALMKHVESLRHHKHPRTLVSDSLCRSHSEASKHFHKSPLSESMYRGVDKKCAQRKSSSSKDTSHGQFENATESPLPSPTGSPPPEYSEIQTDLGDLGESDDVLHEEYGTPPESVVADINMHSVVSKLGQNPNIICMEDDEFSSDTELGHVDDHGPFNGLWKLVRNPAHLAVFMHYLLSSDSYSSLFFYLITDMYEQGTLKEMKKWAYEIHSSFLVPGAPLKVATVDEAILHEIDKVLLTHIDREETLRAVFKEARKKAREELNDLLAVFRNKRTMGLANIFSPPDYQLEEAMQDKNKEIKIIEQLLLSYLENLPDDLENANDSLAAKTFALTTILKQFGVKSPHALNLIDRWPTFVAKEKSRIRFLQRNKKIMFVQGHQFIPQHYYSVTYCNHCQLIIWGVGNQGYQCQNCEMNIHKMCVRIVEEHCIGSLRNKKDKKRDRMSGIMENFIGKTRKPSQPVPSAIEKARKLNEEGNLDSEMLSSYESGTNENSHNSAIDGKADHHKVINDASQPLHLHNDLDRPNFHSKKAPAGIGRSESFRQRRESRPSFRKRSDPNIPRSKSDVEVDDKTATNLNSGSSSNSSLSNRSLDSPSTSSDMVHRTLTGTSTDSVPPYSTNAPGVPSPLTNAPSAANTYDDSDLDAEPDPPNWQDSVEWNVLRVMKPKEKKRQDVINELFHTEKTHVRNLKVLDRIFYKPLLQEQLLPSDFLQLLFPNLEEMIEIHSCFNKKLKMRRKEEAIIGDIGQLLLEMFDGSEGEHLKKAAAIFCQNQSIALESLKMRQKKDQKLSQYLAEAELHNLCRRLQLKDIIASGFQRLTKYPLLLENIAKYTAPYTQELTCLLRSIECSKEILVHVDSSIKESENLHRLSDIQKKLEKSAFEKIEHAIVHSFKNLDVTKHRLVYEGQLTWRLNKQKTVDMHVVLLEDILVLLQKQDEKYVLKFHNTNLTTSKEETKIMHSPILRVHNLLIRNNATDKRSIFLISPSEMHAMYEFVASTASEKKIWCRYLTEAVEGNTTRSEHPLKQPELPHTVPDHVPPDVTSTEDTSNKESLSKDVTKDFKTPSESLENPESTSSCPSEDTSVDIMNTSVEDQPSDCSVPSTASEDTTTTVGNGSEQQAKPQRRLQRVEILKIADGPQLIEPSEVIVCEGAVLQTAEPVLTPLEKLRRKDQEITTAIHAKEKLIEEIFQIPRDVMTNSEEFDESEGKNTHELMSAAVHQGHQLSLLLSEMLNVSVEEMSNVHNSDGIDNSTEHGISAEPLPHSTPNTLRKSLPVPVTLSNELLALSVSMNKKHTQLLALLTEADEEREQLRSELLNAREQLHHLHENHRHCTIQSQSPSNHSQSRPNSFVSVESSVSEDVIEVPEEQPSVLHKVIEETDACVEVSSSAGLVNSEVELSVQTDSVLIVSGSVVVQSSSPLSTEHSSSGDGSCNSVQPVTDLDCDLKATEISSEFTNGNSGGATGGFSNQDCSSQSSSDATVVESSVDPIYF